jgi:hypothetical protein
MLELAHAVSALAAAALLLQGVALPAAGALDAAEPFNPEIGPPGQDVIRALTRRARSSACSSWPNAGGLPSTGARATGNS